MKTIERLRNALTTNGSNFAGTGDAGVAWVETAVKWSADSAAKAFVKTAPLFSWVLDALPGRRHVKLLANSLHAKGRYALIERSVKSLWARP